MIGIPITSTPCHSLPSSPRFGNVLASGDRECRSKKFDDSCISTITTGSSYRPTSEWDYEREAQRIMSLMAVQEDQIMQSCSALEHCRQQHSCNGTLQELTAHRILLLAREKQLALQNELRLLQARKLPPLWKTPAGCMEVSSLKIHLNRNFCLKNTDINSSYAFIVLLKSGENVHASQVVSVLDVGAMRVRTVRFPDNVRFDGLDTDFAVILEVFALKIENRREQPKEPCFLKKKFSEFIASLAKHSKHDRAHALMENTTKFLCCGHAYLSKETVGLQKLMLADACYPLEGTVDLRTACSIALQDLKIEFEGFLSMYQVVQNIGSWTRFWAVLRHGVVKFYSYPDDEASGKPPKAYMDMEKVDNERILCCPPEICSRPDTFHVDIYVNTPLYEHSTEPYILKRVLLNADTYEMCHTWMQALNETLNLVRGQLMVE